MNTLKNLMLQYNLSNYGVMAFDKIPQLINCRAVSRLPQNAKSVIVVAFPYYVGEFEQQNLCKYAALVDYHDVVISMLTKACNALSIEYEKSFVPFVDNSPIPEVSCAVQAGLGFRGKNNLLITKKYGSYVVLGEIVTDCEFTVSAPCMGSCMACDACMRYCPNHAILDTHIDYTRCISKLTQKKAELTDEEKLAIKHAGYAWGCDRCQDCCPHNKNIERTYIKEFLNDVEPLLTESNIDDLIKTRSYGYKGKALLTRNLSILQ